MKLINQSIEPQKQAINQFIFMNLKVNIQFNKKNMTKPFNSYGKVLRLNPNQTNSLCDIAEILVKLNQIDQAVQQYEQVILISPDFTQAYRGLGFVKFYKNNIKPKRLCRFINKHLIGIHRILKFNGKQVQKKLILGILLADLDKGDEATQVLQDCLAQSFPQQIIHLIILITIIQSGNFPEALKNIQNHQSENYFENQFNDIVKVEALEANGQLEEAKALITSMIEKYQLPLFKLLKCQILSKKQEHEEELKILDEVLQEAPENVLTHIHKYIFVVYSRFQEAQKSLDYPIEKEENSLPFLLKGFFQKLIKDILTVN